MADGYHLRQEISAGGDASRLDRVQPQETCERPPRNEKRKRKPDIREHLFPLLLSATILLEGTCAVEQALAVERVAYPEVKVEVAKPFQPDAAFDDMRQAFSAAVASKDAGALFRLVGTTFVWTFQGALSAEFDMGLPAIDNFKIVFGFKNSPTSSDAGGPYWGALEFFAAETTFYAVAETQNLVCSPIAAEAADQPLFELANEKVQTQDEAVIWYFTLADTVLTARPEANAASVTKVGRVALPLLSVHPPQQGEAEVEATHLEVLLPSGKTGWVPISAVRPLAGNRLCYAKAANGAWKIVYFDQNEE